MPYAFTHRHLLDTEALSAEDIDVILDLAETFAEQNRKTDKRIDKFRGRTSINLFFENSTRTRTSFEIAAKRLGMDVVNIPVSQSSTQKGETLLDTVLTLNAMHIDTLVMRHFEEGAAQSIAPFMNAHVINAGDGAHAHPTQALLDALTIRRHKGRLDVNVAICGDVARSRVARSNIRLLKKFGANIRVIAPSYFLSTDYENMGVEITTSLEAGIQDADAIIMLRVQHERPGLGCDFSTLAQLYIEAYSLTHEKLKAAKPDVIILHPMPINRGVEMTSELADDARHSVILEQVEMGVAVRMAVIDLLLSA